LGENTATDQSESRTETNRFIKHVKEIVQPKKWKCCQHLLTLVMSFQTWMKTFLLNTEDDVLQNVDDQI